MRERRLALTHELIGPQGITVCIDETGDEKKGRTTDYVARQYIGNLGQTENGMVSVSAYGVLQDVTFPLLFRVFKPQKRLKSGDTYQTQPALAVELSQERKRRGLTIDLVLADRLYGESGDFITALMTLNLLFVVAIRDNHKIWLKMEPASARSSGVRLSVSFPMGAARPALSANSSSASAAGSAISV